MRDDNRPPEDRLNDLWNAAAAGASPPSEELDPVLAETVAGFFALDDAPAPDAAFLDRLERGLFGASSAGEFAPLPAMAPIGMIGRRPATAPIPAPPPRVGDGLPPVELAPRRAAWLLTQLATAALLLVTLGVGYVALVRDAGRETTNPTGVLVESVVAAEIDALPSGSGEVYLERWRFKPGPARFRQTLLGYPHLIAVEAGTLGGSFDGEEQTLTAGDQVVVPTGQDVVLWNAGSEEVVALILTFPRDATRAEYDLAAMRYETPIMAFPDDLPGGPARIVVERVTIEPGAALPSYLSVAWQWLGIREGRAGITLEGAEMPSDEWRAGVERPFQLSWRLPPLKPGLRVTIRNAGEAPVVLYRVTITPLGPGPAERDG